MRWRCEMTFQQWFDNEWYSNCFTIITVIVSGIISLVISAAYYHKGNRNNLKMNIIHPIIRLFDEEYSQKNYENLCEISKDYTSRYMKKNEMSCLNKLLDAYKEVCRYNDTSVNADSLFSYFEYKLKKNNINPKPVRVEYEGEYVYDDYPPDIFFLSEGLKKILKETPFELESAECEEKISTLYNWYCKEYYAAEPLKYFDDYSLDEVLKKSNIRVKWNEKFDEIQKAKNKFLNLRIAK